jgi:hypothetical protein
VHLPLALIQDANALMAAGERARRAPKRSFRLSPIPGRDDDPQRRVRDLRQATLSEMRQPGVDMTTGGCHNRCMVKRVEATSQAVLLNDLKRVRTAAIEHARAGQELARERRRLIEALLAEGFSQADLARELGVTRQAIQKMVAVGKVSAVTEISPLAARKRLASGRAD